ncbi:MAG: DUF5110 domain-containing protein [Cytophagaceae bacterium]|nr:DUF5110 domain-containing protein [Cytophagaceae bacterium]
MGDTISYPDRKALWSFLEKNKIKAGMWVWDCIMETGNEEVYEDFKSKNFFKNIAIRTDGWHNGSATTIIGDRGQKVKGTRYGNIDFENPAAKAYFKQKMKPFFDEGIDFLKLDKTDEITVAKAMFELSQELGKETKGRGFVFSHSHGVNDPSYKRFPGKWTDDTRSDWTVKKPLRSFSPWLPNVAFKENVEMYLDTTKHFHKIPFLANDMGGFSVSEDGHIDEELYIRWLQFAAFVPLTTPFSQPENKTQNIAFKVSERADKVFKEFSHLKMQLFPYIYTYAHLSRIVGKNTIRPVSLDPPVYLFGAEILVAPVVEQNQTQRQVNLPKNAGWVDFWTGKYHEGGQEIWVDCGLEHIPVFVKKGAIVPMRNYAAAIEKGNNDTLNLHVFTGADGKFDMIEDDGSSNEYLTGKYAVTRFELRNKKNKTRLEIHPTQGDFDGFKSKRVIKLFLHSESELKSKKLTQSNSNIWESEYYNFDLRKGGKLVFR